MFLRFFNWKLNVINILKQKSGTMKTLKVFSFINLRLKILRESDPEFRATLIKRLSPKLASLTANTKKVKIKMGENLKKIVL